MTSVTRLYRYWWLTLTLKSSANTFMHTLLTFHMQTAHKQIKPSVQYMQYSHTLSSPSIVFALAVKQPAISPFISHCLLFIFSLRASASDRVHERVCGYLCEHTPLFKDFVWAHLCEYVPLKLTQRHVLWSGQKRLDKQWQTWPKHCLLSLPTSVSNTDYTQLKVGK